jgi:hypothetical protein
LILLGASPSVVRSGCFASLEQLAIALGWSMTPPRCPKSAPAPVVVLYVRARKFEISTVGPNTLPMHFIHFRRSTMTKIAFLVSLIITALASIPAQAQVVRAFVSGFGSDTNPCTVAQPCRTFQHAHDTVPANGAIEALDPAGYQPLTITKGISIQGHGYSSIFQTGSAAITISVTTQDPVTLNGLLLDGGGTGSFGIHITSGPSVQILNSVIRHFQYGIDEVNTVGSTMLVQDTIASDNLQVGIGIASGKATLNRITANNNLYGVATAGFETTIANSLFSNNKYGLLSDSGSVTFLSKTVISNSTIGINVLGTVESYGDNYISDNFTPVQGSLTPVPMQ